MGRSPRPTTLPTPVAELVAGSSATGVQASDPSQQTQVLPSILIGPSVNTQGVPHLSQLSRWVGYGRIHVDSRHLGVPRAFRGLEGTP